MSSSDESAPLKKAKILKVYAKPDSIGMTHVRTRKCTYLWEIYNYNVCSKKNGEALVSPIFSFKDNDKFKWCLRLYPKGVSEKNEDDVVLILDLKSKPDASPEEMEVEYTFSILAASGQEKHSARSVNWFNTKNGNGQRIITRQLLCEQSSELMPNNVLTILCMINAGSTDSIGLTRINGGDANGQIVCPFPQTNKWQSDALQHIYNDSKYNDITFIVDGRKFHAHKAILAARSSIFAELFSDINWPQVSIVELKDVTQDIFDEILRFVYTAKISDPNKVTNDLLAAAERFRLPDLKKRCELVLGNSLKVENVVNTLVFADQQQASYLKTKSIDFIISNAAEVIKTPAYKQVIISNPQLIVEVFQSMVLKQSSLVLY